MRYPFMEVISKLDYFLGKLFVIFFLVSVSEPLYGQGTITGKIKDSSSNKGLAFATVSVYRAIDTSLVTYKLSDNDGAFRISGIPMNTTNRVVVSFSGYTAFRREFKLTDTSSLDLGEIFLTPTIKTLEEIFVKAEKPPIVVRKDTIEFNASSFKTLPAALVEDLLKKLPGIEVNRDGTITANGRRVNRILVDGKTFFGDNLRMATRNLPADMIDKVQVVPDKEEENMNITGELTNTGQVINLILKKGIKKGWFGKVYAGAGTKERFQTGGIANIFRDTLQVSILGYANNINRSGFSIDDIQNIGGFNRSGVSMLKTVRNGNQTVLQLITFLLVVLTMVFRKQGVVALILIMPRIIKDRFFYSITLVMLIILLNR